MSTPAKHTADEAERPLILTPEQALALMPEGEYIHNFVGGRGIIIGCDWTRAEAIDALHRAVQIEIGGPQCKKMGHPIIVWDSKTHHCFAQADMAKVEAFEAAALATPPLEREGE